ncbi:MAG: alanine--tRNA ligase [Xanthomonadales bacterium]|jgi:alanyl-tRNA synthetase|nr:alanine--tRNA ligase [Xanthomonadales bacterium]
MKSTAEIRKDFLAFFASKGHEVVPSSSLVPAEDPTLLFTNAGMNQFKDVFLGAEKRSYTRAASSQRCVRAGGKHNDLDQVGYTARHHTFFEMLGNFSFGDYFKEDAIVYAWELMTGVYGLDADRLWVTVYETDDEAYDLWTQKIGVPEDRVIRIGDKPGKAKYESDNFWAMGDTGPCGPCSEIFYDHGPDYEGGPPGSPDEDGDRYIEIWNLVFMQFDRAADGAMKPLPAPCVDTGMGLERLAAVLQHRNSNYQIDLMQGLVRAAAELTGADDLDNASLNVIADHIRACAFLISDGVVPSREGRGYVLRRIIRRAVRHGYKLGMKQPFFHKMVAALAAEMGDAYPELIRKGELIENTLLEEEQRFSRTLDTGMGILRGVIDSAGDDAGVIDGATAFLLYDTYGFPLDLTQDVARENGMTVDEDGFNAEMAKQQERARSAGKFSQQAQLSADAVKDLPPTKFLGYEASAAEDCKVMAILADGQQVDALEPGREAIVLLDKTPFYAESGGQVGDTGVIRSEAARFDVDDTIKLAGVFHAHAGQLASGTLKVGDTVAAGIDAARRQSIVLHHSATHLMHAALKEVLGDHVEQRGSLVAPDHLRFDFTHPRAVGENELSEIERIVNREIRVNPDSDVQVMGFDDALKTGATALFGEKYGDRVRVVKFGSFSTELCGGTHVERVGDIGQFKIVEESAIAAGIRRIVAVAGEAAVERIQLIDEQLKDLARVLKVGPDAVEDRLRQLLERSRAMEKEIAGLKSKMASASGEEMLDRAVDVDGVKVLAARLDGIDPKSLRDTVDRLKDRLGSAVVVIGSAGDGKVRIAAGVSQDLTSRIQAGNLVNFVAQQVGGRGGGRPDFAQAGGSEPDKLDEALDTVSSWISENG